MKRLLFLFLIVLCFAGCGNAQDSMGDAQALRSAILQSQQCAFTAKITADYGDSLYTFTLECASDAHGDLAFTVKQPETIAGITGRITADGGNLTFDDTVLYIPMLTDQQIPPVTAPWILLRALRSGYIASVGEKRITAHDSYGDDALIVDITLGADRMPAFAEIYWKNRRFLTIEVESFALS